MTDKKIPFVGLHAHSVAGSIFDAIGYPNEHMDFCYENGGEALALTDHGNMNGFSHQFLHWQKMRSEGKEFKPIFGVEAYKRNLFLCHLLLPLYIVLVLGRLVLLPRSDDINLTYPAHEVKS